MINFSVNHIFLILDKIFFYKKLFLDFFGENGEEKKGEVIFIFIENVFHIVLWCILSGI